MTAPEGPAPRRAEWWTRPRVVLPALGALVVLAALFTPQEATGRLGDPRLSSRLAGSLGARAFAELAQRFGFATASRDATAAPDSLPAPGTTIHAVLAPPIRVAPAVAHAYLERVRAGDALLVVLEGRNPLTDSLGAGHTVDGGILQIARADSSSCRPARDFTPPLWVDGFVHVYGLFWLRGAPAQRVTFATVLRSGRDGGVVDDAAVGFPLGRGRVVVVSDPDLLRNDVIGRCQWGTDVVALRMLEWLRAGGPEPRNRLVFDEYHQGFGPQPSLLRVVWRFLATHPVGRAILILTLAALVLLAAAGARPLVPPEVERVERRDPLEQVDALAHAYQQVAATRTAAARLLRGLRWRVEGGSSAARGRSDEQFLADVVAASPERAADAALVRRALREPLPARELSALGAALRRLEDSLLTTRA